MPKKRRKRRLTMTKARFKELVEAVAIAEYSIGSSDHSHRQSEIDSAWSRNELYRMIDNLDLPDK